MPCRRGRRGQFGPDWCLGPRRGGVAALGVKTDWKGLRMGEARPGPKRGVARRRRGKVGGGGGGRGWGEGGAGGARPAPKRVLARRRRANVAGGRRHRHEVKVTPEEEARLLLLAEAQGVTVPRLLVESALSAAGETPAERRNAIAELFGLHRLLAG